MVYASSDLKHEHDGILHGLKILEIMMASLQNDAEAELDDFMNMVDFLKLFADKCHHGKEENLFFPALEKAGVQNQNGPIGQMLLEHQEARKYIASMAEAMKNGTIEKVSFIASASNYVDLLQSHINKENSVLFPIADEIIPTKEQAALLEQFEEFEEKVMGKGTHERLHETLHRLDEKYQNRD